jgi:hypothetical protein
MLTQVVVSALGSVASLGPHNNLGPYGMASGAVGDPLFRRLKSL